jgi:hypothetical protein
VPDGHLGLHCTFALISERQYFMNATQAASLTCEFSHLLEYLIVWIVEVAEVVIGSSLGHLWVISGSSLYRYMKYSGCKIEIQGLKVTGHLFIFL